MMLGTKSIGRETFVRLRLNSLYYKGTIETVKVVRIQAGLCRIFRSENKV